MVLRDRGQHSGEQGDPGSRKREHTTIPMPRRAAGSASFATVQSLLASRSPGYRLTMHRGKLRKPTDPSPGIGQVVGAQTRGGSFPQILVHRLFRLGAGSWSDPGTPGEDGGRGSRRHRPREVIASPLPSGTDSPASAGHMPDIVSISVDPLLYEWVAVRPDENSRPGVHQTGSRCH